MIQMRKPKNKDIDGFIFQYRFNHRDQSRVSASTSDSRTVCMYGLCLTQIGPESYQTEISEDLYSETSRWLQHG